MKILIIHQYFLEKNEGGGSRFNEMTKLWSEQGHKITVLAGMLHYNKSQKLKKYKRKFIFFDKAFYKNVDVIRCHVSEKYNKNFIGRLWAYFSFVFSSCYAGLFKTEKSYDLILVSSPPLFVAISAYILSIVKRVPFVFEIRDLWPESAIDTGVIKNKFLINFAYIFEKFIYKKSKLINVLTPAFKKKLVDEKNVPIAKIIQIPNAADLSMAKKVQKSPQFNLSKFRQKLGLSEKFVITYVGAHGLANHLTQIVDAAEILKNTNIVFQLIGSGMDKENLKNKVAKKGLNNVIFRDPVSKLEVFKYILASDVGTSVLKKTETFKTIYSNKTFDYMSCKIPVLIVIDGISKELIHKSKCGIYAEPENPASIAKKAIDFSNMSKTSINQMGLNGYNYVVKNFNRKKLSLKYIGLLKKHLNVE